MTLLLTLIAGLAQAAAPDAAVATFSGSGVVDDGSASTDGSLAVFVSGSQARLVDVTRWREQPISDCTVRAATLVEPEGSATELWVGCDNGDVRVYDIIGGVASPATDDEGERIILEASSAGDPVVGLAAAGDNVYAVSDGASVPTSHLFDAADRSRTSSAVTTFPGFRGVVTDGLFTYIAHDNAFISTFTVPGNAPIGVMTVSITSVDDLAPTLYPSGATFTVDRGTGLALFSGFNKSYISVWSLPGIESAAASLGSGDEWGLVAYDDGVVDVLPMNGGTLAGLEPTGSFDAGAVLRDLVVTGSGYTLGGATNGDIVVMTDRPWVSLDVNSLGEVIIGDTVPLDFTVDQPGDYEVRVGGSWTGGGTLVADGTVTAPGSVSVDLTVEDSWPDGTQDVFVLHTNGAGQTGHAWTDVTIDVPPLAVDLTSDNVTFRQGALTVSFDPIDSDDIASYALYLTTEPFEAQDYPTGGPAYVGDDEVEFPVTITDFGVDAPITVEVTDLTDYETYYLAVRATDTSGQEGPMSNVVEARPRPTQTASQRAGDPGGMQCSGTGGAGAAWLGGLGLALLGLRRRRTLLAAGAALLGATLLVPSSPALAQDSTDDGDDEETVDDDGTVEPPGTTDPDMSVGYVAALEAEDKRTGDLTSAWGNVEIRYGYWQTRDRGLEDVFGKTSASEVLFEFGPQLYRVIELDFGAGIHMRKGETVAEDDGSPAGTETRLMIVPLSASITPRLHLFDEQPVVPYASVGGDWWLWREREGDADAKNKVINDGSHFGWHWELGLNILLDTFDRDRASLLEAQSGINDSWITIAYRRQTSVTSEGFDFSGGVWQVGLKIDF